MHLFSEHSQYPVRCLDLVEPELNSYSGLSKIERDPFKAKVALHLVDMMRQEMETIQKAVPEVHKVLVQKANEYVLQIQPNLQEGVKGSAGSHVLTFSGQRELQRHSRLDVGWSEQGLHPENPGLHSSIPDG